MTTMTTAPGDRSIGVLGTGSYLPEAARDNDEIARRYGVDNNWIIRKTGIAERRIAAPTEATSDLATAAGQRALEAAGVDAADLDLVVVATSSPDQPQPATACIVQANLGASHAAAFDMNAVCTGFVYATAAVAAMMRGTPGMHRALVIGADTYSRILNDQDRSTSVLFGDGAGAVVLGPVPSGYGVLASDLNADGRLADLVTVPAGGSRQPVSPEALASRKHLFHMNGREVRQFVWQVVPAAVLAILAATDTTVADLDLVVPHQANGVLVRDCLASLDFDEDRVHYTVDRYGNTGAASVAVTLDDAVRAGRLDDGSTVLLLGFGGGMTWGSVLLRWHA
ncbi:MULTISPECIES: 3-oxoacyl-ACP synthase III family protein [unclassified Frankia]|uniref:3-oxoacyl-ACP synthase III family protein n=1 Tax=unclassified Frankia TaxID=2632575 RepID=UPI0020243744